MKWFINLSTPIKLIIAFGAMWVLLAIVIVTAYQGIASITHSEQELHDVHFTIALELRELRSHQNYNRAQILEMMTTTDKSAQRTIEQDIKERGKQIDDILDTLSKLKAQDSQFQDRLTEMKDTMASYRKAREQQISLTQAEKVEEARQLGLVVQDERFLKIRSIAMELGDNAEKDVDMQLDLNQKQATWLIRLFVILGAFALLAGIAMVALLHFTMAKPLCELTGAAERIAAGDLSVALASGERRDEVGLLLRTFLLMTQSLHDMAKVAERIAAGDLREGVTPQSEKDQLGNSFARMIENLRRSTADISEAVNLLGSSASEILASTTQVASGTAETATAISETTTTVEEVRQAARLSSDKAKNVSDSAQRVAQVSQSGQKAVEETTAGMLHIRDQMESIAQTIVRLSEQSQSIGGIIASVTDLADQSNLLAVNAAIEAARAGEQGKGFAVVAQEIKSLAEQSKQSTMQIRGILNDVQKATSAAVMATEQGSKAVEAGVRQSAQAGEAIRVLAESSGEAAQTATQIVASSQQQVVGMDQIGTAMENINQAGAQTAASMRQAEVAAQNLHELGQKLKRLVEQYKM
jgi:methyl-accepting chemotaxis protein